MGSLTPAQREVRTTGVSRCQPTDVPQAGWRCSSSRVSSHECRRTACQQWTIHGERIIDDTRRAVLSIADVELPDGIRFEQYVLRVPTAAIVVVLDEAERVLMMWRHRNRERLLRCTSSAPRCASSAQGEQAPPASTSP